MNPTPLPMAVASVLGYLTLRPVGSLNFYFAHGLLPHAAHALSLVRRGLKPQPPPVDYVVYALPR